MNPDVVKRGTLPGRQTSWPDNKRGQVFHMNIRADMSETLAGLWFGKKNTLGEHFVVKSLAVELGGTLDKHS